MEQTSRQPVNPVTESRMKATPLTFHHRLLSFYSFLRRVLVAFCLLFTVSVSIAQTHGKLIDSETLAPIPFATLQLRHSQEGTITDINGSFSLPPRATDDSITISCLGYREKQVAVNDLDSLPVIKLTSKIISLPEVEIFPGINPAWALMRRVVDNAHQNNPQIATNYTCQVYHKMVFQLDTSRPSTDNSDTLNQRIRQTAAQRDLLLIESVSEKSHLAPDKDHERLIAGRVSGLKTPALALLPSQLQPFSFYAERIKLLNESFLNPVSAKGLEKYLFLFEDTIINGQDTVFHISFTPRTHTNIKGLSGFLHIDASSLAIKDISAGTNSIDAPVEVQIHQSYSRIDDKQWFPSQLECTLHFQSSGAYAFFRYPLIASAKSMVSAINLDPDLTPKDFSEITFTDETQDATNEIDKYRHQPLTARDSATYHFIDSIGQQQHLDHLITFQKSIIKGFIPAGPLMIDIKRLIGYTHFEGLKLGLGLSTNQALLQPFSLAGFYNHAFLRNANNYGGEVQWTINQKNESSLSIHFKNDLSTTGDFSFLKGPTTLTGSLFKGLSSSTMDKTQVIGSSLQSRLLKYFRIQLFLTTTRLTPLIKYPFYKEDVSSDTPYTMNQSGIKLRWHHKENLKKTSFGWFVEETSTPSPTVWLNYTYGRHNLSNSKRAIHKIEGQIEQKFYFTPSGQTTLRVTGGIITGTAPTDQLYSNFGTFRPFSLEIPFMFSTMSPNEFAADKFSLLFLRHQIPLRINKPGHFKPELILTTNAGWGTLSNSLKKDNISSFPKGYYESGIYLSNLFRQLLFKYGLGIHYRYGPYQKAKSIDNFSFRLGLELAL